MTATVPTEVLAIRGGTPVRATPFPARHLFGTDEKAAAMRVFDESMASGAAFGYNGPEEAAFEQEFAAFMGGGFADGVNSGTNAVFVALGALQLPKGSEVIVSPITDPGGVMPVVMLNCIPVFADADPRTFNMDPARFEARITPRTRAAVVAHIAGEPADMEAICGIARRHGIMVVEDCAQAHAATLNGRKVGSFGDIAAFSTMSGKHFATGAQGGVVYTANEQLHWRGKRFADRGKPFHMDAADGNVVPALNCNLNDLSAAIGRVQLAKLPQAVAARRAVAEVVREGIAPCKAVSLGWQVPGAAAAYWFLRIRLDMSRILCDKHAFVTALQAEGIPANESYRHIPAEAAWARNRGAGWNPYAYGECMDRVPVLHNAIRSVEEHFTIAIHERCGGQEGRDIGAACRKVERAFLR